MQKFPSLFLKFKPHYWALLLVLFLSAFLNTHNINFSRFYHADEPKKIRFVLSDQQDFRHPILMIQTGRLLNQAFGLTDPDKVIILCRMVSAFCGVLLVMLTYFLGRRSLGKNYALLAALALAVSPTFVIHAHYFKEDLIFTACAYLSLLGFLNFLKERTVGSTFILGIATGLALSAQYKGVLLILLFFIFPKNIPDMARQGYYRSLRKSLAVMGVTFLLVNYPLVLNLGTFFTGFITEIGRAIGGHTLYVYPFHHWFGFHLVNSLIPGMSLAATLLALGGLAVTIRQWKSADVVDKLLLTYALIFYFFHEISPMKPYPDYMRYMTPIVPALAFFAAKAIQQIDQRIREGSTMKWLARGLPLVLAGVLIITPGHAAWTLTSNLINDTRSKAREWVDSSDEKVWFERYALGEGMTKRHLTEVDILEAKKSGVAYLIASSFNYERFFIGAQWSLQQPKVYEMHKKYVRLFSYPYIEIKPAYKSFAFSNPVIRIIDIRDPENQEK